jgi:ribosomal protein L11 methyltransferase
MNPETSETVVARLITQANNASRLADALSEHFEGDDIAISTRDDAGALVLEVYFASVPDQARVRAIIATSVGDACAQRVTFETISARDWIAESLAGLHPVSAGRFVIHGAHDRDRVRANQIGIEIEAALAFGTGHHGTTRGCLIALQELLKAHHPRRVLDVGTGTGVLAIAAARARHQRVLASDIDRDAVAVARANAVANKAGPLITVVRAGGLSAQRFRSSRFDLVLANILLVTLKSLAKPMARLLAPNARVVLSGLLPHQANAALSIYRAHGLVLERRITLDGWMTLVLAQPA